MCEVPAGIRYDEGGLVPVVAQDRRTGAVLMVAWADAEAVSATADTGSAHFHSRSRDLLWRKGATSGNTMRVCAIRADCDGDTLLYEVEAEGPACHTGAATCFDATTAAPRPAGFFSLERLDAVIADRVSTRPDGSYVAALVAKGPDGPARKVIEEAAEAAFASKDHAAGTTDDRRVAEEVADLLFHAMVLLAERGIPARTVIEILEGRARPA
jgi:phosphoribosyl-ATP pyrophosphohydrolase/phosphoribosyl-AMP cyclohydrolase